jgi:hypothetical protein
MELLPKENTGVETVGVIVIALDTGAEGPLHPLAVTKMFTVPE